MGDKDPDSIWRRASQYRPIETDARGHMTPGELFYVTSVVHDAPTSVWPDDANQFSPLGDLAHGEIVMFLEANDGKAWGHKVLSHLGVARISQSRLIRV